MSDEQTEMFGDVMCEIQGDLSQRQFAKLAGDVSPASVNDWLQSRPPKLKLLLQVAEALEEAEYLDPSQRERLFRAAGYVDPRRDRSTSTSAPSATSAATPAPDLKAHFANRQPQASLDRLLRQYGELIKWCEAEGLAVPPLDGGSFGGWSTLTDQRADAYIQRLREDATRGGKRSG